MTERTTDQSESIDQNESIDREGIDEAVGRDDTETEAVVVNDEPAVDGEDATIDDGDQVGESAVTEADTARDEDGSSLEPLLASEATDDFRSRWETVQAGFVDEPREAVQQADVLVESLTQRLAESFSERRDGLEQQWDRGDEVSTEDLRQALRSYRSFFDRLLRA